MTKYNYVVNKEDDPRRAPQRITWKVVRLTIYNPKTGAFLRRTPLSWAKILLYFVCFYSGICALFSATGFIALQTLDKRFPKFMLDDSLIGTSPGLGYRPLPTVITQDSIMVSYRLSPENYSILISNINDFLEERIEEEKDAQLIPCNLSSTSSQEKECLENMHSWFPCTKENSYGYSNGTPCFFIKLNKIMYWKPVFYDLDNLPSEMPQDLKAYINAHREEANTVWLSCGGDEEEDEENIGPIKYIPRRGFPGYYYPYTNAPHYVSPLVAIYFENPTRDVIITVECRAWAQNIEFDHFQAVGSVRFQIHIESH